MNKALKIVLMVCAIVLVLAISGSVIYYYVFFRTGIEKEEIRIQEQKSAEESLRKNNLERCLKEAEDWKRGAFGSIPDNASFSKKEAMMKIVQEEYQDKIDACNMLYGK